MAPLAATLGCAGTQLDDTERAFFRDADPWGLIVFKRNIEDRMQLRALVDDFRSCVGRADAPVLIDQEGGRVQRMGPPEWPAYPAAAAYADLFARSPDLAAEAARLGARLIAADLAEVGITVDCLPCLDLRMATGHEIIGDRSYGEEADQVSVLGRVSADGLMVGGVLPVIKHIPGHGRATVDSHYELPVVGTSRDELARSDFLPFASLADLPMGMTAHVLFSDLDPNFSVTQSSIIISEVIRGQIGFDGLLMTDDLAMEALAGDMRERTEKSIAAGCDVALYCAPDRVQQQQVAEAAPQLEGKAAERAASAQAMLRRPEAFDLVEGRRRFRELLGQTVG